MAQPKLKLIEHDTDTFEVLYDPHGQILQGTKMTRSMVHGYLQTSGFKAQLYRPGTYKVSKDGRVREVPVKDETIGTTNKMFDRVVMEDWKRAAVLEALEQGEYYDLIFNQWGFGEVMEKGRAISMLFYGEPGTGKTLLAQAIAERENKELMIIGTAEIESSEPGGAERAIKEVFDSAQRYKKVLLFDECDSLISDRSQVGVIIGAQVNQLLTCLERFDGIVIFTTNRLGVLDEAVNRRLSLKLEFAMPDQAQRADIWRKMYPKKAPVDKNVDWHSLAEAEITGGYIKNVVLRSARMTASRKLPTITHDIILEALEREKTSMDEFRQARRQQHLVPRMGGKAGFNFGSGNKELKILI